MRPFKAVVIGALLAIGLIVVLAQTYTQPYYGIFYGDGSNLQNIQGPSIVGNISVPNIFVLNLYGTNAIINQETVGQGTVTNLTAININAPVVANNNGFGTNEYFLNTILAGVTTFLSTNNYLTLSFLLYGTNFAGFDGTNFYSFGQLFLTNGWNWPVGSAAGTLQNDGSGNLTWTPVQGVTIPNTITPTNFVLNTTYTNTSGSIQLLDVSVALITATVSGNASIDLYADQSGGTSFTLQDRAAISTLAGVGLAVNYTNNLSGAVSNKACYYFTNSSSGAGNSAVLIAGTGERITLSDGAAAGVAFLASPNVFTANQFVDSAHTLSLSNSTANRMAIFANDHTLTNAGASGAVPIDADGSATTIAQVTALGTIGTSTFVTGNSVPLTNSINSTNEVFHYGAYDTNDTTGNWEILTNGGLFISNKVTGAWLQLTNDSVTFSNLNGFTASYSNGVFSITNRTAANAGIFISSTNLQTVSGGIGQTLIYDSNGSSLITGLTNGGGWFAHDLTDGGFFRGDLLPNRAYWQTNGFPLAAGAINVDFRGAFQFITTNANFTVAGFVNQTNNLVNQVWMSVSNSSASGITMTVPGAPVRYFGTNTASTYPIAAAKVLKCLWQADPQGTNLIQALMQNN